jgi:hypothetical protein
MLSQTPCGRVGYLLSKADNLPTGKNQGKVAVGVLEGYSADRVLDVFIGTADFSPAARAQLVFRTLEEPAQQLAGKEGGHAPARAPRARFIST